MARGSCLCTIEMRVIVNERDECLDEVRDEMSLDEMNDDP